MNVTSTKSVRFPQFQWGIHAGETRSLPENEEARAAIMAHRAITEVGDNDDQVGISNDNNIEDYA